MMENWREESLTEDNRYIHQVEASNLPEYNYLKNKYFLMDIPVNGGGNMWWNNAILTEAERTDPAKDGIKAPTESSNLDALQLLKKQYDQALVAAVQNIQLADFVQEFMVSNLLLKSSDGIFRLVIVQLIHLLVIKLGWMIRRIHSVLLDLSSIWSIQLI